MKWYIDHKPDSHKKAVCKDPQDDHWRLTIEEKKRILTTHLFGVDIDRQAVEVSKLSLLLKALEGENDATMSLQLQLFHNRALPNLADNIKCGNSLIGPSYFAGRLPLDREDGKRVNAFDWKTEFPDAHRAGGFDCIIGNPPYIRIQTMQEWAALEVGIYKELFQTAREGNYDIYVVFVERGLQLLNPHGRLGFICPHKFFNAKYGVPLRSLIAGGKHLAQVVYFGDQQVFDGATTYTCLLFLDKSPTKEFPITKVRDLTAWCAVGAGTEGVLKAGEITGADWNFSVGNGAALFARLREFPAKLGDIADRMAQGIRTSANEIYVLDIVRESSNLVTAHSDILDRDVKIERKAVSLFLQGREIKPYRILPSGKVVIAPYTILKGRPTLIPEKELKSRFPLLHNYLLENKGHLTARERGRFKGAEWFRYGRQQNIDLMLLPKILVPDIADRASFALDEKGEYAFTSGYGITLRPDVAESPKYILGLLNSAVLDFYLKRVSTTMRGGFFRYFTQFIEQLPIRRIDFNKSADKSAHDRVVSLVESMLASHKQNAAAKSEADREIVQRQIKSIDADINRRVYDLYGLTDQEIAIVEGSVRAVAPS